MKKLKRASIHEEAQEKLSRLNQEYLQSLDNLIGHLTRHGKLAPTLAVRAERNRLLSIIAGDAASKDKAEQDGSRVEKPSPESRPMPRNSDYIYLCDLSVISAQADRFMKGDQEKWEVNGKKVRKGLLAWAPSEIAFDLTGLNVVTLDGSVGIAPANVNSTMRFEVFGDDKVLWQSGVMTIPLVMGEKEPEAPKKKQSEAAKEPNAIEENLMVRDPDFMAQLARRARSSKAFDSEGSVLADTIG
jgi:NPCBM/NEW2 domain